MIHSASRFPDPDETWWEYLYSECHLEARPLLDSAQRVMFSVEPSSIPAQVPLAIDSLPAPFDCCFMELIGGGSIVSVGGHDLVAILTTRTMVAGAHRVLISPMFCHRGGYFLMGMWQDQDKIGVQRPLGISTSTDIQALASVVWRVVTLLVDQVTDSSHPVAIRTLSREYKYKLKLERRYINVPDVTVISKSVERAPTHVPKGYKYITEFSHRFWVRGFWRSISPNAIGKDPSGCRNQVGRTWVVPHLRGPDYKPIKSQIHVVPPRHHT